MALKIIIMTIGCSLEEHSLCKLHVVTGKKITAFPDVTKAITKLRTSDLRTIFNYELPIMKPSILKMLKFLITFSGW